MSLRFQSCVGYAGALVILVASGCVVSRTVKEDGVIVAKGYVVKAPL